MFFELSTELCTMECGSHGVCSRGICQCEEGWVGPTCEERSCHSHCAEHGQCKDGKCECSPGWEGDHCTIGKYHHILDNNINWTNWSSKGSLGSWLQAFSRIWGWKSGGVLATIFKELWARKFCSFADNNLLISYVNSLLITSVFLMFSAFKCFELLKWKMIHWNKVSLVNKRSAFVVKVIFTAHFSFWKV